MCKIFNKNVNQKQSRYKFVQKFRFVDMSFQTEDNLLRRYKQEIEKMQQFKDLVKFEEIIQGCF